MRDCCPAEADGNQPDAPPLRALTSCRLSLASCGFAFGIGSGVLPLSAILVSAPESPGVAGAILNNPSVSLDPAPISTLPIGLRHCEERSDEAVQFGARVLDCFVASLLAMTESPQPVAAVERRISHRLALFVQRQQLVAPIAKPIAPSGHVGGLR